MKALHLPPMAEQIIDSVGGVLGAIITVVGVLVVTALVLGLFLRIVLSVAL